MPSGYKDDICKYLNVSTQNDIPTLLLHDEFVTKFAGLCLHSMQAPWVNQPPSAPAPGAMTTKCSTQMLKHTLLFYNVERLNLLGEEVAEAIREDVRATDRLLLGAVARPNYYCTRPQPLATSDDKTVMVPCGKIVPLSPLLQMVKDNEPTKEWICEDCLREAPAPGGAQELAGPMRCLLLNPVVKAKGRQGQHEKRVPCLDSPRRIELIVAMEPDPWTISDTKPSEGIRFLPHMVSSSSRMQAVYNKEESEHVWRMAARWS